MSKKTRAAQKSLVTALGLQALLPFFCMSQSAFYIWKQFEFPGVAYLPYYEEWVFLSLAVASSISPFITIWFVKPYRESCLKPIFRILVCLKVPMRTRSAKVRYFTRTSETAESQKGQTETNDIC
ncbi:unnamed protein product, partial [Mesorhabditis spiculigera]